MQQNEIITLIWWTWDILNMRLNEIILIDTILHLCIKEQVMDEISHTNITLKIILKKKIISKCYPHYYQK